MNKELSVSIRYLKGIGPRRALLLQKIGILSIEDLLYYFPFRYEDRTNFKSISELMIGDYITVKASILARSERKAVSRKGFSIFEVMVGDDTGRISCVWFNQGYLKDYFNVGEEVILYGKIDNYGNKLQMVSPEFEIVSGEDDSLSVGRIVPVYSLPEGMTQRYFRKIIKEALNTYLPQVKEFLPYELRFRNNMLNLPKAILNIHFPENNEAQKEAYRRISFDEFFLFQMLLVLKKFIKTKKEGVSHFTEGELVNSFLLNLPFRLTEAQNKALSEIKDKMRRPYSMHLLLQGDVGSGKTVVATIACIIAIQSGYQAVFMVPTEILARQHYEKIKEQVAGLRINNREIRVVFLSGGLSRKEKESVYKDIFNLDADLVIGTHALLEGSLKFNKLGMVVIDEQHKFGVAQRAILSKKGSSPDVLIMTATPIPRTLAITLYADMDISVINELPPGRGKIYTSCLGSKERYSAYDIAKSQLKKGSQVYIVYPVIEESYSLDIRGAEEMFQELKNGEFKDWRVGLIHGRIKQKEQDDLMHKFKNGELDILVCTTVLEVGIDVANATCMIIENAERFGLSQLHQLRGRIGRGKDDSFCILISDTSSDDGLRRLRAMVKYSDGFKIAEEDLKIRGPGEFFGSRQHGLTDLKMANPLTQMQLLKLARDEAIKLFQIDPYLKEKHNTLIKERLKERFPGYEKLVMVG